jgi:hypothetical protein
MKRKLIIFIVLFCIFFIYLPLINCVPNSEVKEKFCNSYGFCIVDVYYSLFAVIIEPDLCTNSLSTILKFGLTVIMIIVTISLSFTIDYLYIKYRDK